MKPWLKRLLFVAGVAALLTGLAIIYSARHGNLQRAPGEVQRYKDQKMDHLIAEGFSVEEARRHAFVFGYLYTLADDLEFTRRRLALAYASLSVAIISVGALSFLAARKSKNEN